MRTVVSCAAPDWIALFSDFFEADDRHFFDQPDLAFRRTVERDFNVLQGNIVEADAAWIAHLRYRIATRL